MKENEMFGEVATGMGKKSKPSVNLGGKTASRKN